MRIISNKVNIYIILYIVLIICIGIYIYTNTAKANISIQSNIHTWVTSLNSKYVTPALMVRIAEIESNLDPLAASPAGCKGLNQFCSATWKRVVRHYGSRDGVKLEDIWQAKANTVMAVRLAELNSKTFLLTMGRPPLAYEIYMMHNIGPYGTTRLLIYEIQGQLNKVVHEDVIGSNPYHNPKYLINKGYPVTVKEALRRYKEDFTDVK